VDPVIGPARQSELPQIERLLASHRLPLHGVGENVGTSLVARTGAEVVGIAAVELYSDGALLRSVAVHRRMQGRRVGERLVGAAFDLVRRRGLHTIFLLTTTADRYFPRLGFEEISRDDVPPSVQESVEFRSACPVSATVMRKRLT
jgi:amino-acid N-acetyltransferase